VSTQQALKAHSFFMKVDIDSCRALRMDEDRETMEWWGKQSKEARDEAFGGSDRVPILEVMRQFIAWFHSDKMAAKTSVWSHGSVFDIPILQEAMLLLNLRIPWNYINIMDTRTLFRVAGYVPKYTPTAHRALDDAVKQAIWVQEAHRQIHTPKRLVPQPRKPVTIMTYHIANGEQENEIDHLEFNKRLPRIAAIVEAYEADIVCLQGSRGAIYLAPVFSNYQTTTTLPGRTPWTQELDTVVLWKGGLFECMEYCVQYVSVDSDSAMVCVRLKSRASGYTFWVFTSSSGHVNGAHMAATIQDVAKESPWVVASDFLSEPAELQAISADLQWDIMPALRKRELVGIRLSGTFMGYSHDPNRRVPPKLDHPNHFYVSKKGVITRPRPGTSKCIMVACCDTMMNPEPEPALIQRDALPSSHLPCLTVIEFT
jgi:hypothetical protein